MLLSLHILKTGGQSFEDTLAITYGPGKVFTDDYGVMSVASEKHAFTNPLPNSLKDKAKSLLRASSLGAAAYKVYLSAKTKTVKGLPPGTECICGHFSLSKYLSQFPDATLVTWVRDPVDRLASLYNYLLSIPESSPEWFKKDKPSFKEFALSSHFKDGMTTVLEGVPLERFDFIGLTERYDESLTRFGDILFKKTGLELKVAPPKNVNPKRKTLGGRYDEIDPMLREEIYLYHSNDTQLYRKSLQRFESERREIGSELIIGHTRVSEERRL
jgi:hypothetical protein